MKKKLLLFVNPNAGQSVIRFRLMEIVEILSRGGNAVTVHPTEGPGDLTEMIAAEGAQYDTVVVAGGDGTLNEAVSGLMRLEEPPLLGYIPGGTVNDVASSLRLPKNPLEAAAVVVSGRETRIDVGGFNDRWFAYVAAFGAFTGVAYRTAQSDKRILGRLAYLLRGVQAVGEIRPIRVRAEAEGQTVEDDVILGLVASTTSVGGFRTKRNLNISLNDGISEVILAKNITKPADLNAVANAILKQDFNSDYFYVMRTGRVSFTFAEEVPWTLDGEFGGSQRSVSIQNHKQALRILVPAHDIPALLQ